MQSSTHHAFIAVLYEVEVNTADTFLAGTDDEIELSLSGGGMSWGPTLLPNGNDPNYYEQGSTHTFRFTDNAVDASGAQLTVATSSAWIMGYIKV